TTGCGAQIPILFCRFRAACFSLCARQLIFPARLVEEGLYLAVVWNHARGKLKIGVGLIELALLKMRLAAGEQLPKAGGLCEIGVATKTVSALGHPRALLIG